MKEITLEKLGELFNKEPSLNLPKEIAIKDGYLTSRKEYEALATLCNLKEPKTIFEIGTFEGTSTLILAMNAKADSTIYTLDLPNSKTDTKFDIGELNKTYTGFKGKLAFEGTKYSTKINPLKGDSATFDFSKYKDNIDFVFVDGAHTYDYTKNDTEKALSMIRGDGIILWHDYNPSYWPDTVRFLDDLAKKKELFHVKDTYLVFMIKR